VMLLAVSDWLTGRKELGALTRVFRADHWSPGNVILVAFAVAIGGVSSNLLASMISDVGWTETFVRFPLKACLYAALVLASAIVTTVVVVR